MKNNKAANIIMNIIIVVLCIFCFLTFVYMIDSFNYAKEQGEKKSTESDLGGLNYDLEHGGYESVLSSYYTKRLYDYEAPEGYEYTYKIGEYCHLTFMSKIYEAQGDETKIKLCEEKREAVKEELDSYSYISDEVDGLFSGDK